MTIKQEIKSILKTKGKGIVDERIIPELSDNIAIWTGELMRKITTLSTEDDKQVERVYNRIHADLVGETIRRLLKIQYDRKK